jgi:hypothetical protein
MWHTFCYRDEVLFGNAVSMFQVMKNENFLQKCNVTDIAYRPRNPFENQLDSEEIEIGKKIPSTSTNLNYIVKLIIINFIHIKCFNQLIKIKNALNSPFDFLYV